LRAASYVAVKQPESVSVALGQQIGEESIRLLIASGGNDWKKGQLRSLKRKTIRIRI
jgi:hypothetical protein